MINLKLKDSITNSKDELTALRRKLHSEPELSFEEFKTTAFVCEYLDKLGISYRKTEPTGVIAEIQGLVRILERDINLHPILLEYEVHRQHLAQL